MTLPQCDLDFLATQPPTIQELFTIKSIGNDGLSYELGSISCSSNAQLFSITYKNEYYWTTISTTSSIVPYTINEMVMCIINFMQPKFHIVSCNKNGITTKEITIGDVLNEGLTKSASKLD